MSRFDTVRRGVSLALAVFCLLVVPELASAKFAGQATVSQPVGTASLQTPIDPKGLFGCDSDRSGESVTITVLSLGAGAHPDDTRYVYTLKSPRSKSVTKTDDASVLIRATQDPDRSSTVWTLTIQPVLGKWTGPTTTTTVQCNRDSDNYGAL